MSRQVGPSLTVAFRGHCEGTNSASIASGSVTGGDWYNSLIRRTVAPMPQSVPIANTTRSHFMLRANFSVSDISILAYLSYQSLVLPISHQNQTDFLHLDQQHYCRMSAVVCSVQCK